MNHLSFYRQTTLIHITIMKKTLIVAVVAIMTALHVNAQKKGEFNFSGLFGGNLSTITNHDDAKVKFGWDVGGEFGYMLSDEFGISLGVINDQLGAKSKELDENFTLRYVDVPLLAKYYVTPWLALKGGPQIGFLTSAKIDDKSFKDDCNKTVFSIPLGICFEPNWRSGGGYSFVFDIRYHLGLSNVYKAGETCRNSAIIFTIGYKFGFMQ